MTDETKEIVNQQLTGILDLLQDAQDKFLNKKL